MADDLLHPLDMSAMESICRDTAQGWLWYCDEHDAHGNADNEDEARHMAAAHVAFFMDDPDADPGDECPVIVWQRTGHERVPD